MLLISKYHNNQVLSHVWDIQYSRRKCILEFKAPYKIVVDNIPMFFFFVVVVSFWGWGGRGWGWGGGGGRKAWHLKYIVCTDF